MGRRRSPARGTCTPPPTSSSRAAPRTIRNARYAYRDSIRPILDAGLADEVADDADLGDGLRLEPSPGHTPGHVSLWIESAGERALVTGDFMHHPVQFAEPDWAEIGDADVEIAARHVTGWSASPPSRARS